jgi:transcriptional repressor NrdR
VYRNFASLEDFEGEIALLRALPSSNAPIASESLSNTTSNKQSSTEQSNAAPQKIKN